MDEIVEKEKGELCVLDPSGDLKHIWDPDNDDEVEEIRKLFNSLKAKRYLIYRVKKGGEKGETMNSFDPSAGKLIAVPAVVGG